LKFLETGRKVRDVASGHIIAECFSIGSNLDEEKDRGLDVNNAGQLRDFRHSGFVKEMRRSIGVGDARAWWTVGAARSVKGSSDALAVHRHFIEQIESLEPRKQVALQSQSKRNHCDDDRDTYDHAHRSERRAQLRLAEIAESQFEQ